MTIDSKIEFAWGADLTASAATWTWTSAGVYARGSVTLQYGAADEASQTQPTTCKFRLDNADFRFSPRHPLGIYYPNVRLRTPVRVSMNPGTGMVQRFLGYVDEFQPVWPAGDDTIAEVLVTASGILRRLGQGAPALRSPMYRAYKRSGPDAYWPLEDGAAAVRAEKASFAGGPMNVAPGTSVAFATTPGPAGSAPVPAFSQGGVAGSLVGTVPVGVTSTSWRAECSIKSSTLQPAVVNPSVQWLTYGTVASWQVGVSPLASGGLYLQYVTAAGVVGGPFFATVAVDDDQWHHIRVDASQSGGDIAVTVQLAGTTVITQTVVGATIGAVNTVIVNPNAVADSGAPSVGHVAVWVPWISSVDTYQAFLGYAGETAGDRIVRIAGEEGIPCSVSSTTGTTRMGPQLVSTALANFRDAEAADGGLLYDGAGAGITYTASQDRMSLAVTVALDTVKQQVKLPFEPVEDDQRVRNQWTVTRLNGGSQTLTDTEHVARTGGLVFEDAATVNVYADTQTLDEAGWRTNLGTVEEMRVPGIRLQLIDHPELWASWLAMAPGRRMTCDNLPAQYPPGTLDMALEGAVEQWDAVSWTVDATTAPYAPWRVAQFAADTGDTSEFVGRFDATATGSTLAAAVTSTATTATVQAAAGVLWTTATDDFPLDIAVSGQRNRVSGVSAAILDPFTRTVSSGWGTEPVTGLSYTTSGGAAADHNVAAGAATQSLTSMNVRRIALLDVGYTNVDYTVDVSLPVASATGASITQWIAGKGTSSSSHYYAQLALTTTGTVTLTMCSMLAGVETTLNGPVTVAASHSAGDVWRVRLKLATQTMSAKAWLASGAEPSAFQVSVLDITPLTGTQIGLMSRLETGNTNVTPVVVTWDNLTMLNPQRFTFSQRGVNGVTKALTSGSAVSLWAPLVFAK